MDYDLKPVIGTEYFNPHDLKTRKVIGVSGTGKDGVVTLKCLDCEFSQKPFTQKLHDFNNGISFGTWKKVE